MDTHAQRIHKIEEEIQTLKAQWPAHSVKGWMLQKLEDLEDELVQLRRKINQKNDHDTISK